MYSLVIFAIGGVAALATRPQLKKAAKAALRSAVRAGQSVARSVEEASEDLDDLAAKKKEGAGKGAS